MDDKKLCKDCVFYDSILGCVKIIKKGKINKFNNETISNWSKGSLYGLNDKGYCRFFIKSKLIDKIKKLLCIDPNKKEDYYEYVDPGEKECH